MSAWLEQALRQVEEAKSHLGSAFAGATSRLAETDIRVDEGLRALAEIEARVDAQLQRSIDHSFVLGLIRSGNVEGLSAREARYAVRLVGELSPGDIGSILQIRPECARDLARQCLAAWSDYIGSADRTGYMKLLMQHPAAIPAFQAGLPLDELLSATGPNLVAQILSRVPLTSLRDHLTEHTGIEPRWEFASAVVGAWFEQRRRQGLSLTPDWRLVCEDEQLQRVLIPPRSEGKSSTKAPAPPSGPRTSMSIHAAFAATVVDAVLQRPPLLETAALDWLTDRLLSSSFRDPLVPPETEGWRQVRSRATHYEDFRSSLIRDDLEVFFQEAMSEPDRKQFWLRYLPAIRRTMCLLGPSLYKSFHDRLGGADEKRRATLRRARRFSSGDIHAFCIYFDQIVVVEFSHSGNAAYVYTRAEFEERFRTLELGGRMSGAADLKRQNHHARILHHRGWQSEAADLLERNGVPAQPKSKGSHHASQSTAAARPGPAGAGSREVAGRQPVVAQGYSKFHRPDCMALSSSAQMRHFVDREAAMSDGLKPCWQCKP